MEVSDADQIMCLVANEQLGTRQSFWPLLHTQARLTILSKKKTLEGVFRSHSASSVLFFYTVMCTQAFAR